LYAPGDKLTYAETGVKQVSVIEAEEKGIHHYSYGYKSRALAPIPGNIVRGPPSISLYSSIFHILSAYI
jgi:hypothetical protein